jgi:hypothetical protein
MNAISMQLKEEIEKDVNELTRVTIEDGIAASTQILSSNPMYTLII